MAKLLRLNRPILFPLPIEWLFYAIASVNLLLVGFDLSYFNMRDIYLNKTYVDLRWVVTFYDPYKGTEPNFYNEKYLETVEVLTSRYRQDPKDPAIPELLMSLRDQSKYIIDNDPYARVDKTGTLEQLKNKIRRRMKNTSATQSFQLFWSSQYLTPDSFRYYEKELRPLIEANYFRKYGEDGAFIDRFWQIDLYFQGFFALELLTRALYLVRVSQMTFFQALSSRWYDFIWLIPTVHWGWLRLLRFIPYTVRSDQLGSFFSTFVDFYVDRSILWLADQVADQVVIRIIDTLEFQIRSTDYTKLILESVPNTQREGEWQLFINRQGTAFSQQILPEIEPEVTALVKHFVSVALQDNPGYRTLRPLLGNVADQAVEQFIHSLYGVILQSLQRSKTQLVQDTKTQALTLALTRKLSTKLAHELKVAQTIPQLQDLLIMALEDLKANYQKNSPDPGAVGSERPRELPRNNPGL